LIKFCLLNYTLSEIDYCVFTIYLSMPFDLHKLDYFDAVNKIK